MHAEDFLASFDVGVANGDLTVKPARTQQRRVQHVFTVCSRDDDHALVCLKAVHFHQQLVQRLLTLIVATTIACAAVPTHGVNLVNEYDAGGVFLGLLKHIAHTACTDAHEHLYEI